jgi:hypothetical protein
MSTNDTSGSPVPGIIAEPVRVQHDEPAAEGPAGGTPTAGDPGAEREGRREAREARREPPAARSGVMIPNRRKPPLEAPLMRGVATAGIVGVAVVIAAIMSSQGSEGWLIGLVVSIASLVLAAVLWSSRRLKVPAGMPSRVAAAVDRYQRTHRWLGLPIAAVYKFGDDKALIWPR